MLGFIKLGISKCGPVAERALRLEREHKGWWPFAFTLLAEIQQSYTGADEPLLDRIYQSIPAGDEVRKITRRGRFRELDDRLVADLEHRFPAESPIIIHDMAASNAITSLELFRIAANERPTAIYATDY